MTSAILKVDTHEFDSYVARVESEIGGVLKAGLMVMAKDAAMLARSRIPHNMPKTNIKWAWMGLGAAVVATGAPAAYDGGVTPHHAYFSHPIFASRAVSRKQWNWSKPPGQKTSPFIEVAVAEIAESADDVISELIQVVLDK